MTNATPGEGLIPGVKMIDRDHREMSEVLQEIRNQIATGKPRNETNRLLSELALVTRSHFALEEGMMAATDYPGTVLHRLRHQWMMDQIKALTSCPGRKDLVLAVPLLELFSESHVAHMNTEDLGFGLWLNGGVGSLRGRLKYPV